MIGVTKSAIAGALWQFVGPDATFWAGAALAGISGLLAWSTLNTWNKTA